MISFVTNEIEEASLGNIMLDSIWFGSIKLWPEREPATQYSFEISPLSKNIDWDAQNFFITIVTDSPLWQVGTLPEWIIYNDSTLIGENTWRLEFTATANLGNGRQGTIPFSWQKDSDGRMQVSTVSVQQSPAEYIITYHTNNSRPLKHDDFYPAVMEEGYDPETGDGYIILFEKMEVVDELLLEYYREDNSGVTWVRLPDGVTESDGRTFNRLNSLETVYFPDTLETIDGILFDHCPNLSAITIPSSVKNIEGNLFYGCTSLSSITFNSTQLESFYGYISHVAWLANQPNGYVYLENYFLGYKGSLTADTSFVIQSGTLGIARKEHTYEELNDYRPKYITAVTIPNGVKFIGVDAFSGTSITSLSIPNSVETIDGEAFGGCTKLTSIIFGNGLKKLASNGPHNGAFRSCGNLTDVTLPEGLKEIGDGTFRGCSGLTSIVIPASVEWIGEYAFSGTNISSITILSDKTRIHPAAFMGTPWHDSRTTGDVILGSCYLGYLGYKTGVLEIPEGIKHVTAFGFDDWTYESQTGTTDLSNVTEIVFPASLKTCRLDGYSFFPGAMSSLTIPDSVDTLYLDLWGSQLSSLTIGSGVKEMEYFSLYGLSTLRTITFGGIEKITGYLYSTTGITSISFGDNLEFLNHGLFPGDWINSYPDGHVYLGKVYYEYKGNRAQLTEVMVSGGTKHISNFAFSGCTNLTSVTIPDSVVSIGGGLFSGCTNLKEITFLGTKEDWKNVKKNTANFSYLYYDFPRTVHCSDGDVIYRPAWRYLYYTTNTGEITEPNPVTAWSAKTIESYYDVVSDSFILGGDDYYVNGLPDDVFSGNTELTSVTLKNTIFSIGGNAFSGCTSASAFTLPALTSIGNCAFDGCSAATFNDYVLQEGLTYLGQNAFRNCLGIEKLYIPSNFSSPYLYSFIYAFSGCTNVKELIFNNSVAPSGVGSVMPNITDLTIASGCTQINNNAFGGLTLDRLVLGSGLSYISASGFTGTTADEVYLDAEIGFSGKTIIDVNSIKKLIISGNLGTPSIKIDSSAATLSALTIEEGVESLALVQIKYCPNLSSVTIPDSVFVLGVSGGTGNNSGFNGCSNLSSVTIGTGVTMIPYGYFESCGLTSINIPNNVTSIEQGAFWGCTALSSATIPVSVTKIGTRAFENCTSLNTIYYSGTMAQWNNVSKGIFWKNNVPATVVHCSDGDAPL